VHLYAYGSYRRGGAWVAVYLGFVLAPLFALLIGPLPPSRDFWTEFSVAIGYSGLVRRARFACSLIVLVTMALRRGRWKIRYEIWHALDIALAVTAVVAGLAHMIGRAFYLDAPWKRTLWIGLTLYWIGLLLYVPIVKPLFLLRRPYCVSEVRRELGESVTLAMAPDGHAGFRFRPSQFGWLTLSGKPFQITTGTCNRGDRDRDVAVVRAGRQAETNFVAATSSQAPRYREMSEKQAQVAPDSLQHGTNDDENRTARRPLHQQRAWGLLARI
jgi:hypothetical protein